MSQVRLRRKLRLGYHQVASLVFDCGVQNEMSFKMRALMADGMMFGHGICLSCDGPMEIKIESSCSLPAIRIRSCLLPES